MWSDYREIKDELLLVEDFILKNAGSRNKLLDGIVNGLVKSGGKRIRPALVILSAKFGKYNRKKVIPTAGAVEILHTATLVHDDVIDRARLRRGNPTVADSLGVDMAVYAGDFLFTKSVLMLSAHVAANRLNVLAKAIKAICEGEVDQYQSKYNIDVSVFSYLKRISRKTAVLFSASCALGADMSKCPESIFRSLVKFGYYYGMAFQIKDDICNYASSKDRAGKPVGNDILEGVITLPVILGIRNNPVINEKLTGLMANRGNVSLDELNDMIEMVKESGGIEDSRGLVKIYIERGLKALDKVPGGVYRDVLEDIIKKLGQDC